MLTGVVNGRREATLPLRVFGMAGLEVTVTAVIDTGFDGYLALPPALVTWLRLLYRQQETLRLFDGSQVPVDTYGGAVEWHGKPHGVVVCAVGTDPLIGMKLLADSELWLEGRPGGAVEITPAPPPPAPAP